MMISKSSSNTLRRMKKNDLNLKRNRDRLIVYAVTHTKNMREAGEKLGMNASAVQKAYMKIRKYAE